MSRALRDLTSGRRERRLRLGARESRRRARVGVAAQDVGLVQVQQQQQQQFVVDVELEGVVEHFALGLSLLQLQHRNVRRRAHPGALVKSSLCVCPVPSRLSYLSRSLSAPPVRER